MPRLAQATTPPVKARPPSVAGADEDGHQDERLQGNTQCCADAEDGNLVGREDAVSRGRRASNGKEEHETCNGHDIVEDRGKHRCAEVAARIEHLAQQCVNAVEEDLRQA